MRERRWKEKIIYILKSCIKIHIVWVSQAKQLLSSGVIKIVKPPVGRDMSGRVCFLDCADSQCKLDAF
jgi:hypothetical protein